MTKLAKSGKTAWHGFPNMSSRTEITVYVDSEVSNCTDRMNICASDDDRRVGKLRLDEHHITSVFSPLSCRRFDRIHLYMSSTYSVMSNDGVDVVSNVVRNPVSRKRRVKERNNCRHISKRFGVSIIARVVGVWATTHCLSDLDQGGLKTRHSAQGNAFWGSERCAPKFLG